MAGQHDVERVVNGHVVPQLPRLLQQGRDRHDLEWPARERCDELRRFLVAQ